VVEIIRERVGVGEHEPAAGRKPWRFHWLRPRQAAGYGPVRGFAPRSERRSSQLCRKLEGNWPSCAFTGNRRVDLTGVWASFLPGIHFLPRPLTWT